MKDLPSLTLKRQIKASPARIFKAWTDPAKLVHWFGPRETEEGSVVAETDLRVGGAYNIRFRSSDGREHGASGVYQEVVPDEKLVFTWTWLEMPEMPTLMTITLRGEEGGTMLTLTHALLADEATVASHRDGWEGAIDKLERFVTRGAKK
ncbi:activator of HSP90 ATPase [Kaistia sp. 32K]|uniref:SRPBCC family protein n=1 Tax=Kaistia sp. 32K TaxID=2795690 RepID=UPI001935DC64|nr:SRPBCC domain-containing protein [Kaistia sp. 32K]BCP54274.1 activator of HSP90 ATPase [Kaistia sp. 32K]